MKVSQLVLEIDTSRANAALRETISLAETAGRKLAEVSQFRRYEVKAKDKKAEIWIYQEIGPYWDGISAKQFAEDLRNLGTLDEITLHINSPGGDVFDGIAIYNVLKQNQAKVTVYIDGLAASIASVIAMAGDRIVIASNAMMMIHPAWTIALGDAKEMRKTADMLDKVDASILTTYANRTGKDDAEIWDLMKAETWFTAQEALDNGFVDEIAEEIAIAARFDLKRFNYRNVKDADLKVDASKKNNPISMDHRAKLAHMSLKAQKIRVACNPQPK